MEKPQGDRTPKKGGQEQRKLAEAAEERKWERGQLRERQDREAERSSRRSRQQAMGGRRQEVLSAVPNNFIGFTAGFDSLAALEVYGAPRWEVKIERDIFYDGSNPFEERYRTLGFGRTELDDEEDRALILNNARMRANIGARRLAMLDLTAKGRLTKERMSQTMMVVTNQLLDPESGTYRDYGDMKVFVGVSTRLMNREGVDLMGPFNQLERDAGRREGSVAALANWFGEQLEGQLDPNYEKMVERIRGGSTVVRMMVEDKREIQAITSTLPRLTQADHEVDILRALTHFADRFINDIVRALVNIKSAGYRNMETFRSNAQWLKQVEAQIEDTFEDYQSVNVMPFQHAPLVPDRTASSYLAEMLFAYGQRENGEDDSETRLERFMTLYNEGWGGAAIFLMFTIMSEAMLILSTLLLRHDRNRRARQRGAYILMMLSPPQSLAYQDTIQTANAGKLEAILRPTFKIGSEQEAEAKSERMVRMFTRWMSQVSTPILEELDRVRTDRHLRDPTAFRQALNYRYALNRTTEKYGHTSNVWEYFPNPMKGQVLEVRAVNNGMRPEGFIAEYRHKVPGQIKVGEGMATDLGVFLTGADQLKFTGRVHDNMAGIDSYAIDSLNTRILSDSTTQLIANAVTQSLGMFLERVDRMHVSRRRLFHSWKMYVTLEASAMLDEDALGPNYTGHVVVREDPGPEHRRYVVKYVTSGFWITFDNVKDGIPTKVTIDVKAGVGGVPMQSETFDVDIRNLGLQQYLRLMAERLYESARTGKVIAENVLDFLIGSGGQDFDQNAMFDFMTLTHCHIMSYPLTDMNAQQYFDFTRAEALIIINRDDARVANMKELMLDGWARESYIYLAQFAHYADAPPNCVTLTFVYLMLHDSFENMIQSVDECLRSVRVLQVHNTIETLVREIKRFRSVTRKISQSTIFMYVVESSQVMVLGDSEMTITDFIRGSKNPQDFVLTICLKIVVGDSEMSHMTPTTREKVVKYIELAASDQMRKARRRGANPGYVMERPWAADQENAARLLEKVSEDVMEDVFTLDIETYSAKGVAMEPYLIVVYGREKTWIFDGRPDEVLARFEQEFLRDFLKARERRPAKEMREMLIYAHNGSKFDYIILMPALKKMYPSLEISGTATDIKMMRIPELKVTFHDFYLTMTQSLEQIAKTFKVSLKDKCDDILNVRDVRDIEGEVMEQIRKYCVQDCRSLFECVEQFAMAVRDMYAADPEVDGRVQIRPQIITRKELFKQTSSSLALDMFTKQFMAPGLKLFGTMSSLIEDAETDAYFGGVTQTFVTKVVQGEDCCRYLDVNSLYPAAMSKVWISREPGSHILPYDYEYQEEFGPAPEPLDKWSLYRVTYFEMYEDTIGFLAVRTSDGNGLCYPRSHKGPVWRAGVELVSLTEHRMLRRLVIDRVIRYPQPSAGIFTNYIKYFYERKSDPEATQAQRALYKSLLNQLYGQMGQRRFEKRILVKTQDWQRDPTIPYRKIVFAFNAALLSDLKTLVSGDWRTLVTHPNGDEPDEQDRNEMVRFVTGMLERDTSREGVEEQAMRKKYIPEVNIIRPLGQDNEFMEFVFAPDTSETSHIGSMKRVALMVTAQARTIMINAAAQIRNAGLSVSDHILYMDTDSFVMTPQAYDVLEQANLVHASDLGKFQDEMAGVRIVEAQFIAPKVYYLKTSDKQFVGKFKGVRKAQVVEELFREVLSPKLDCKVSQERWNRNFGNIMITDLQKSLSTTTRRYIRPDGSSQYFASVSDFEGLMRESRLTFEDGEFQYTQILRQE